MSTAFEKGKKTIIYPAWRDERKHLFCIKDFTSALAMWAVRQSPYDFPIDLTAGLAILRNRLIADHRLNDGSMCNFGCDEIREYLCQVFDEEPVFKGWNTPKEDSGKKFLIVDRYSRVSPHRDFIDTDAMARNISHIMFIERLHWED